MDDTLHFDGFRPTYQVITLRGAHGASLWRWWLRGGCAGGNVPSDAAVSAPIRSRACAAGA